MVLSDTGWDMSVPADNTFIKNLPSTTRTAKDQIGYRLEQEHTDFSSSSPDYGGIHVAGSAVVFASNDLSDQTTDAIKRPGSGLNLTEALDKGRLSIPTDGNNGLYFYETVGTWTAVGIVGMDTAIAEGTGATLLGDQIALLPGRAGGQSLIGGTGDDEKLNLSGSSHANKGPIEIVAAQTTLVDFNAIRATSLGAATSAGDALSLGNAAITLAELSVTGSVAVACIINGTSDGADVVQDIGFAPDYMIGFNDVADDGPRHWLASANRTKNASSGSMDAATRLSLSSTTVTVVNGGNGYVSRGTGNDFVVICIKTNKIFTP